MSFSKARLRIACILTFSVIPALGISKNNRIKTHAVSKHQFVCGTSPQRDLNAVARGLYHEQLNFKRPGRDRLLAVAGESRIEADIGDVAVIEDDGTLITATNPFDLDGKSFSFEPAGANSYRVSSTSTGFNASGGTRIPLSDDDSRPISLEFSFTFYGASYTSVYVNSDGNLTFNTPDAESTDRDLARFAYGPPRISAFFNDLDPSTGSISFRRDSDGIVFIWENVPQFDTNNANSFSMKLFTNGIIEFVYGPRVDGIEAITGITPGSNQAAIAPVNFSSDLPTGALSGAIVEVFSSESIISETLLAKKFYQGHPDDFDHLIIFLDFDFNLGDAYAYEINIKNEISGIGLGRGDNTSFFGSSGRLRSLVMMGSLTGPQRYPNDPNQVYLGTNSTLGILGQESGHRWLAFTRFRDGEINSRTILGRDAAHWSFFFDSDGSVMEGNDIQDRGAEMGNTRFVTVRGTDTLSRLDQYAIGLVGQEDVPNMFVVENVTGTTRQPGSAPQIGVTFGGTRKEVTIDSIITANGAREPSVLQSPKVFRQAFILLTKRGQQPAPDQIAKVQNIRNAWVKFFNEQSGERGWIVTDLQRGPGTTPASIYLPYFQGDAKRFTGLALANWGSTPADVLFTAFDNGGNQTTTPGSIINPRMVTIGPGKQVAMLAEQVLGLSFSDPRNGWIQAQSTSSQVTGFFLDGDSDQNLLDGAVAGNQTYTELYFTRAQLGSGIFLGNTYKNLIDVVNPNATSATLEFRLTDSTGAVQAMVPRTLAPRGRIAEDLSTLFPGIAQPRTTGYVKLTSNVGVIGYQSIDGGVTVFALPAQPPSTATKLYSAQFASGGAGDIRFFTDLNFINTSAQPRTIQLQLIGNNGTPVTPLVSRQLAPGAQIRTRGESIFDLPDPALATVLTEGSLVVTADGPGVIGDVTFGDPLNERFVASLPLDGTPASNLVLSQVAQGSGGGPKPYFTGVALFNPNDNDVMVTLDVFSEGGVKTGTVTFPLARGNRTSRTLPQFIPAISEQLRGYIRITVTGGSVIAFELFGDQALEFLAAVPPQPI
jgi:hypothetical protein